MIQKFQFHYQPLKLSKTSATVSVYVSCADGSTVKTHAAYNNNSSSNDTSHYPISSIVRLIIFNLNPFFLPYIFSPPLFFPWLLSSIFWWVSLTKLSLYIFFPVASDERFYGCTCCWMVLSYSIRRSVRN